MTALAAKLGVVATPQRSYSTFPSCTDATTNVIGKGGCGCVYAAVAEDGEAVAVKSMKKPLLFTQFMKVVEVWAAELLVMVAAGDDAHPNVLSCYSWQLITTKVHRRGTSHDAFQIQVAMPLMDRSVNDLMKQGDERMEPQQLLRLVEGAAAGLAHMHGRLHKLHNDVKADNLLVDVRGNVVVADFGMCCSMTMGRAGGYTRGYLAPEREVSSSDACPGSDMWALGVDLARLFTRNGACRR